eukprot:m.146803 g.146803  ORF g.146803 m.146803 type:complete len:2130 (-) comp14152_c1_seq1:293-6682(-)
MSDPTSWLCQYCQHFGVTLPLFEYQTLPNVPTPNFRCTAIMFNGLSSSAVYSNKKGSKAAAALKLWRVVSGAEPDSPFTASPVQYSVPPRDLPTTANGDHEGVQEQQSPQQQRSAYRTATGMEVFRSVSCEPGFGTVHTQLLGGVVPSMTHSRPEGMHPVSALLQMQAQQLTRMRTTQIEVGMHPNGGFMATLEWTAGDLAGTRLCSGAFPNKKAAKVDAAIKALQAISEHGGPAFSSSYYTHLDSQELFTSDPVHTQRSQQPQYGLMELTGGSAAALGRSGSSRGLSLYTAKRAAATPSPFSSSMEMQHDAQPLSAPGYRSTATSGRVGRSMGNAQVAAAYVHGQTPFLDSFDKPLQDPYNQHQHRSAHSSIAQGGGGAGEQVLPSSHDPMEEVVAIVKGMACQHVITTSKQRSISDAFKQFNDVSNSEVSGGGESASAFDQQRKQRSNVGCSASPVLLTHTDVLGQMVSPRTPHTAYFTDNQEYLNRSIAKMQCEDFPLIVVESRLTQAYLIAQYINVMTEFFRQNPTSKRGDGDQPSAKSAKVSGWQTDHPLTKPLFLCLTETVDDARFIHHALTSATSLNISLVGDTLACGTHDDLLLNRKHKLTFSTTADLIISTGDAFNFHLSRLEEPAKDMSDFAAVVVTWHGQTRILAEDSWFKCFDVCNPLHALGLLQCFGVEASESLTADQHPLASYLSDWRVDTQALPLLPIHRPSVTVIRGSFPSSLDGPLAIYPRDALPAIVQPAQQMITECNSKCERYRRELMNALLTANEVACELEQLAPREMMANSRDMRLALANAKIQTAQAANTLHLVTSMAEQALLFPTLAQELGEHMDAAITRLWARDYWLQPVLMPTLVSSVPLGGSGQVDHFSASSLPWLRTEEQAVNLVDDRMLASLTWLSSPEEALWGGSLDEFNRGETVQSGAAKLENVLDGRQSGMLEQLLNVLHLCLHGNRSTSVAIVVPSELLVFSMMQWLNKECGSLFASTGARPPCVGLVSPELPQIQALCSPQQGSMGMPKASSDRCTFKASESFFDADQLYHNFTAKYLEVAMSQVLEHNASICVLTLDAVSLLQLSHFDAVVCFDVDEDVRNDYIAVARSLINCCSNKLFVQLSRHTVLSNAPEMVDQGTLRGAFMVDVPAAKPIETPHHRAVMTLAASQATDNYFPFTIPASMTPSAGDGVQQLSNFCVSLPLILSRSHSPLEVKHSDRSRVYSQLLRNLCTAQALDPQASDKVVPWWLYHGTEAHSLQSLTAKHSQVQVEVPISERAISRLQPFSDVITCRRCQLTVLIPQHHFPQQLRTQSANQRLTAYIYVDPSATLLAKPYSLQLPNNLTCHIVPQETESLLPELLFRNHKSQHAAFFRTIMPLDVSHEFEELGIRYVVHFGKATGGDEAMDGASAVGAATTKPSSTPSTSAYSSSSPAGGARLFDIAPTNSHDAFLHLFDSASSVLERDVDVNFADKLQQTEPHEQEQEKEQKDQADYTGDRWLVMEKPITLLQFIARGCTVSDLRGRILLHKSNDHINRFVFVSMNEDLQVNVYKLSIALLHLDEGPTVVKDSDEPELITIPADNLVVTGYELKDLMLRLVFPRLDVDMAHRAAQVQLTAQLAFSNFRGRLLHEAPQTPSPPSQLPFVDPLFHALSLDPSDANFSHFALLGDACISFLTAWAWYDHDLTIANHQALRLERTFKTTLKMFTQSFDTLQLQKYITTNAVSSIDEWHPPGWIQTRLSLPATTRKDIVCAIVGAVFVHLCADSTGSSYQLQQLNSSSALDPLTEAMQTVAKAVECLLPHAIPSQGFTMPHRRQLNQRFRQDESTRWEFEKLEEMLKNVENIDYPLPVSAHQDIVAAVTHPSNASVNVPHMYYLRDTGAATLNLYLVYDLMSDQQGFGLLGSSIRAIRDKLLSYPLLTQVAHEKLALHQHIRHSSAKVFGGIASAALSITNSTPIDCPVIADSFMALVGALCRSNSPSRVWFGLSAMMQGEIRQAVRSLGVNAAPPVRPIAAPHWSVSYTFEPTNGQSDESGNGEEAAGHSAHVIGHGKGWTCTAQVDVPVGGDFGDTELKFVSATRMFRAEAYAAVGKLLENLAHEPLAGEATAMDTTEQQDEYIYSEAESDQDDEDMLLDFI